ncbi:hypothetical protein P8452_16636 [Trifolium repens]|nr:hypothetical protein P8452_16636 [Trifolium repens]
MSGVWVFNPNGVMRLVDGVEAMEGCREGSGGRRKRYYDDPDLLQFHKHSTIDLISIPMDFNRFKSMHMYDIVVKNKHFFEVRDMML